MRQALRIFLALLIATFVMLFIRAYAFTTYSVPTDIDTRLRRGDCILVDRLSHTGLQKGDIVVVNDSLPWAARIQALPGDTLIVDQKAFTLPVKCCPRCCSRECMTYLVATNGRRVIIQQHDIQGKAHRLFHLPW